MNANTVWFITEVSPSHERITANAVDGIICTILLSINGNVRTTLNCTEQENNWERAISKASKFG